MIATKTLQYYNTHACSFTNSTVAVHFSEIQDRFLKYIPNGSRILDFGCGSGRDAKYFIEQGFIVEAIDGSEELCKLASEYTGINVKHRLFQELSEVEKYDGIWACASILHLPYGELTTVISKICKALKKDGCFYASFKYGDFEGMRNGRYFTDLTKDRFNVLLAGIGGFVTEEV